MSLRFETLVSRRLPVSLGYIGKHFPKGLARLFERSPAMRSVLRYEAHTLRAMEARAVANADAVTLVSAVDADHLRKSISSTQLPRIHVVPPGIEFTYPTIRTRECKSFLFVGGDTLLQNSLTIQHLIDVWRKVKPKLPLHIVGRMTREWPVVPGVNFLGFVEHIEDVYRDDCIALCPSFIEGGVKTKVLEAIGHGVMVVGNKVTFDGIGCDAGRLAMTELEMELLVREPAQLLPTLLGAAHRLRDCVYSRYSSDVVTATWSALMRNTSERRP